MNTFQPPTKLGSNALEDLHEWNFDEAKARFSEVVQLAQTQEPQRVTVRGENAVVILSAEEFSKIMPLLKQPSLHDLLSQSPLSQIESDEVFERVAAKAHVREVKL